MHYLAYVVFVEVYKCLARSFLIIFIPQTLELVSEKGYSNYPVQYIYSKCHFSQFITELETFAGKGKQSKTLGSHGNFL
jgi:hypothetical protein